MRTEKIKHKLIVGGSEAVEAASDLIKSNYLIVDKMLEMNEIQACNLDICLDYNVRKLIVKVLEQIEKPVYYAIIWYYDIENYGIIYSCRPEKIKEYERLIAR